MGDEGGRCPICGGPRPGRPITRPGLRVSRCRDCGHRVATHEGADGLVRDYHEQYAAGPFLQALRATRERQARLVVGLLRAHVPGLSRLVDYGAGRAWFLEACRSVGIAPVAGVDTSRIAVEGLEASGFEARLLPEDEGGARVLSSLSFRPRVVTLLDVLEHFPPERVGTRLQGVVSACGSDLELVVVKVPVPGLLYAGASALVRVGVSGPLRQLYQVGTWPPHLSYFSPASAERLLATAGLSVVRCIFDRDFEPEWLGPRIGADRPAARALARIGGEALGVAVRVTRWRDSIVLFARPTPWRL